MSSRSQQVIRVSKPFQWLAAALPLLVIGLGILACRPDWHAALHAQKADTVNHQKDCPRQDSSDDQGCAIHMYASGLMHFIAWVSPDLSPNLDLVVVVGVSNDVLLTVQSSTGPPGRAPPFIS